MSDLHTETAAYVLPETPPGIDAIIIAGDVAEGHRASATWLRDHVVPVGLPLIFVAGNHDFYGGDLDAPIDEVYGNAGVTLLHHRRPTIDIAGVRIIGLTLWTDYHVAGNADAARSWARQEMPDLRSIDRGMRRVHTRDLLELHRDQRGVLERELEKPWSGKTLLVTHHAPHSHSLRQPQSRSPSDGSYASDLTTTMQQFEPDLWIHGHVHQSYDYEVYKTRVICNPRGYQVTRDRMPLVNPDFQPSLVVEI
jgi:predicted phosphodiesterase